MQMDIVHKRKMAFNGGFTDFLYASTNINSHHNILIKTQDMY